MGRWMARRKRRFEQGGRIEVARPSQQYQGPPENDRGLTTKKLSTDHRVTWSKIWNWLAFWKPKKLPEIPQPQRRTVDTQGIRTRITSQGWRVREIPIRKSSPDPNERLVVSYRLLAGRGDRSIEVSGPTIDEAFKTLGETLGVIPRNG